MEETEVKSRTFAKEEFSIERDCLEMLHRKPRVSKNVFQAYHKEIMEIAKAAKQLLLDIIEKKRKWASIEYSDKFIGMLHLSSN